MNEPSAAVFDPRISEENLPEGTIPAETAERLFVFFKQHPLFHWENANNGCEGRADAVCLLLDEWKIPNKKAWVFSGFYLQRDAGQLGNYWNYHVAPLLPVDTNGTVQYYVLDPATAPSLLPVQEWAEDITHFPHTYYGIRQSHWYIFPAKQLTKRKWHTRNKRNRKWMIQCLAGINGLHPAGKARIMFNRKKLARTAIAFKEAFQYNPLTAVIPSPVSQQ